MRIGLLGMRRRIADYDPALGFDSTHLVLTIAGFLIGLSVLIFFYQFLQQHQERRKGGRQCVELALTRMAGSFAHAHA